MNLLLNDILKLSEEEVNNSKIEFNMQAGRNGIPFIDVWLNQTEEQKQHGISKGCGYWGWYGDKRNFRSGQIVVSFVRITMDEWLLTSIAKIIDTPEKTWANVEVIEKYKSLFGRLIVKCVKGNTNARYVLNLRNYIEKAVVKEILPCIYSGDKFEGYDRVHLPHRKLIEIYKGNIMPTYYEALKKISGIYCLTDNETGKLYIGSASGQEGIAQRWANYLETSHGGNKKLISLYKEKGSEYFEKNFTFTLIEYFGLSYDTNKIIEREQYWKKCFNTTKNGYNDN